jgi:protein-tyrosine phosphatase
MSVPCNQDMNWIIPGKLGVGNMDSVMSGPWMVKNNIGGVISVRGRLSKPREYYKKYGIEIIHIPVADCETTNLGKFFPSVFNFIEHIHSKNKAVLINCYAGISRSTTLITSYVMRKYKMPADKAMAFVKSKRPCYDPNPGFIQQLKKYEVLLRQHHVY